MAKRLWRILVMCCSRNPKHIKEYCVWFQRVMHYLPIIYSLLQRTKPDLSKHSGKSQSMNELSEDTRKSNISSPRCARRMCLMDTDKKSKKEKVPIINFVKTSSSLPSPRQPISLWLSSVPGGWGGESCLVGVGNLNWFGLSSQTCFIFNMKVFKGKEFTIKQTNKQKWNDSLSKADRSEKMVLTLQLPCVTKTEFFLTISMQYQEDEWWE